MLALLYLLVRFSLLLQILIDAVVHAVNKDYPGMAEDFIKLGFLAKGGLTGFVWCLGGHGFGGCMGWFAAAGRSQGLHQAGLPGQGWVELERESAEEASMWTRPCSCWKVCHLFLQLLLSLDPAALLFRSCGRHKRRPAGARS